MIDLVQAVTTGATVAGALKGLSALEAFVARRNGKNGHPLPLAEHDALMDVKRGVDLLHEDLVELRQDLRDCMDGKRL